MQYFLKVIGMIALVLLPSMNSVWAFCEFLQCSDSNQLFNAGCCCVEETVIEDSCCAEEEPAEKQAHSCACIEADDLPAQTMLVYTLRVSADFNYQTNPIYSSILEPIELEKKTYISSIDGRLYPPPISIQPLYCVYRI